MIERIMELCALRGIKVAQLEKTLGFANGSLKKTAETTACGRVKAIADFFGVSMEYLLTGEENRRETSDIMSPLEREIIEGFRACDVKDQETIVFLARRAILQKKDDVEISSRSDRRA